MKLDISEDERYPYVFITTLERELAWGAILPEEDRAREIQQRTESFLRRAIEVPDDLANEVIAARAAEQAAVDKLVAWMKQEGHSL